MADHSLSDQTDIRAIAEHIDYEGADSTDDDGLDDFVSGYAHGGTAAIYGGDHMGYAHGGTAAIYGADEMGFAHGGSAALYGDKGVLDDMSMKEAQDAIRQLLIYVRDGRLKAGVPTLKAVHSDDLPSANVSHVVAVDTVQSAAHRKTGAKKSEFEDAVDDLVDDKEDEEDAIMGEEGSDEEIEPIDLRFKRPDHDHNIHAWKQGDNINVSMRVLKADGEPRVLTATTSHEEEMANLIECLKELGYTPDKILRLPLAELAARIGASSLVAPVAKNAGAILGLDGRRARAPYVCGLVK
jgi:hypothetical protein